MIENTTSLANATKMTTQLEVESIGDIILSKLIAVILDPSWIGNVLLFILIVVTIGVAKMAHKRSDFYNRFQQIYDDLLKLGEVELRYDIGGGLIYTQQDHQEWKGFIDEVNKQIKRKWWKYKARGLYEKVEKAVDDYKEYRTSTYQKITSVFTDKLKKEGLGSMIWGGVGDQPLEDYVEIERIPSSIENIIKGSPLEEGKSGDGRYTLKCPSRIAKTTSKDMIEKLRDLIQSLVDDEGIKELFAKRDKAKGDVDELLKRYNNKLDVVIQDLRFCRW